MSRCTNIIHYLATFCFFCQAGYVFLVGVFRPDAKIRRQNESLVEMVLGPRPPKGDKMGERWHHAITLLNLDTGSWSMPTIQHHCSGVYCCRNGKTETRRKLWSAILATRFNYFDNWSFGGVWNLDVCGIGSCHISWHDFWSTCLYHICCQNNLLTGGQGMQIYTGSMHVYFTYIYTYNI